MSSEDVHLLKIKQQQIKMIQKRGYDVSKEDWILKMNNGKKFVKKLIELYGNYPTKKLLFSEYTHADKKKPLFVMYIGLKNSKTITVDSITSFVDKLTLENKEGLLITNSTLSPTANEYLNIITEHPYQLFKEDDLLYDVSEHTNVPKYTLLSAEEATKLKVRIGLSKKGVGAILTTDPICKYYNYPVGSYVRVVSYHDIGLLSQTLYDYRIVKEAS